MRCLLCTNKADIGVVELHKCICIRYRKQNQNTSLSPDFWFHLMYARRTISQFHTDFIIERSCSDIVFIYKFKRYMYVMLSKISCTHKSYTDRTITLFKSKHCANEQYILESLCSLGKQTYENTLYFPDQFIDIIEIRHTKCILVLYYSLWPWVSKQSLDILYFTDISLKLHCPSDYGYWHAPR